MQLGCSQKSSLFSLYKFLFCPSQNGATVYRSTGQGIFVRVIFICEGIFLPSIVHQIILMKGIVVQFNSQKYNNARLTIITKLISIEGTFLGHPV
jgi:hypothetical protein